MIKGSLNRTKILLFMVFFLSHAAVAAPSLSEQARAYINRHVAGTLLPEDTLEIEFNTRDSRMKLPVP